jgi:transposase-like protein
MGMPVTLLGAVTFFASADNCRDFMVAQRWVDGVVRCPQCDSDSVYFDAGRNRWECKTRHPKRTFTLKTGTIFEDSPLGLDKWLPCVWMIANCKNGISSHEIARALGVTQKTGWFMLQRIRLAMQGDSGGKLGGDVEIDETFIGGRARNISASKKARVIKASSKTACKVAVMGLLERHGNGRSRLRTAIVPSAKRAYLRPHVDANVEAGANVYTDALRSYDYLGTSSYIHSVIDTPSATPRDKSTPTALRTCGRC